MWHLDNFGTLFTNGTLTIAVNGLLLGKDWVNPKRLPLWDLLNYSGLLQAAEEVRAISTKFTLLDYFPFKTKLQDLDASSIKAASHIIRQFNGVDPNVEPYVAPAKKLKSSPNLRRGSTPNRRGSLLRETRCDGGKVTRSLAQCTLPNRDIQNEILSDVTIRPLRDLAEAEARWMLNRKWSSSFSISAEANGCQSPHQLWKS